MLRNEEIDQVRKGYYCRDHMCCEVIETYQMAIEALKNICYNC